MRVSHYVPGLTYVLCYARRPFADERTNTWLPGQRNAWNDSGPQNQKGTDLREGTLSTYLLGLVQTRLYR